jgi:hypothetical protein
MSTEITITTREQLERHILATVALEDNPKTPAHIAKLATQRAIALTYRLDAPEFSGSANEATNPGFKIQRVA